jgi:geranylgeranyl diphosphate synthase, type II
LLDFELALEKTLKRSTHFSGLRQVLDYAVRPPGKLFRPRLLEALCADLGHLNHENILFLGQALELHHAYTLVHDDLPCMDNDVERRGKPTAHIQYGEWKALLAGDSLLILSFQLLNKVRSPQEQYLRKFFTWATGPKGLILGQWLDLDHQKIAHFQQILRIHELKTARLMQVASLGAYYLSTTTLLLREMKTFLRLGSDIGICFQLLDDLDDLNTEQLSDHENNINPFLLAPEAAIRQLSKSFKQLVDLPYPLTKKFIHHYLKTSCASLKTKHVWQKYFQDDQKIILEKLINTNYFSA